MSRPVGINLLWMVHGVVGGSEDGTVAMLRGLVDLAPPDLEPVVLALPSFAAAHPRLAEDFEVIVAPVDGSSKGRRVLAENTWLPRVARRRGLELVHHGGGVVPPGDRSVVTLTVHDLQPLDLAANFSIVKRRYLSATLRPSVRRARLTAVPSEFTRGRVVDALGADPDRVVVVPWPVTPVDAEAATATELPEGVSDRSYVLYPAITYPHKNHLVLLDAFARVVDRPGLRLVLIGGEGSEEGAVRERIDRPDLRHRVLRLGRVPEDLRDALVARALLVAVPSRYEGFGLPALEAMAAGVPVVVSDAAALDEVVAPGTPRVGVDDVDGWAEAITTLAGDAARRAELSEGGRDAAARFSTERTASAMADLWRRALEEKSTTPP